MRVTVLGCGGSQGVPSATGDWGKCDPADARNYRRRPALLVEGQGTLLIDTPPELREQLVRAGVRQIDGVLFTHGHADHVHGLDDLRGFARVLGRPIPAYGEASVLDDIRSRFGYAFDQSHFYRPVVAAQVIDGPFEAAGMRVVPFAQDHGFGPSTGFRIGALGYSIDVVRLPETAFDVLAGISHWVVDCQQLTPHPTHSHLAQTLDWIRRVGPQRAVLTHLGSGLDYQALSALLPPGVEPGYDGLMFEV